MFNRLKQNLYNLSHPIIGEILMLHRVTNNRSALNINRQFDVTPAFLEKTITNYLSKNYHFFSLDDVYKMLKGEISINKPFICFTLDDGYKDNFEEAYPVFKKYNCPFAIYVATDYIDRKFALWQYLLEDLILANDFIKLSDGTTFNCGSMIEKNQVFMLLYSKFKSLDQKKIKSVFDSEFALYNFSFDEKADKFSLSRDQLKILAADDLCTIASHTISHPYLSRLSLQQQQYELIGSKQYLEALVDKEVFHFSYPNGDYNSDSVLLASQCGYRTAAFAWGGEVRSGHSVFELPRIIVQE